VSESVAILAADVCLFSTEATMSGTQFFKTHRSWEDWISMLIGVLIGFSPWLADQQGDQAVMWNAILIGAVVLVLAQLEYVSLQRWEEIGGIIVGLWLIASPFIFGYAEAGPLRYWHFGFGAIIVLLAAWALWQDWRLSDKELAQYGQ
jgi:SPW repeat